MIAREATHQASFLIGLHVSDTSEVNNAVTRPCCPLQEYESTVRGYLTTRSTALEPLKKDKAGITLLNGVVLRTVFRSIWARTSRQTSTGPKISDFQQSISVVTPAMRVGPTKLPLS